MITEREKVRNKKANNEDKPWTIDPILQKYRFTNVRRMDDKVSQWLLNNWYVPYKGHPHMPQAVTMARFFNLPSSLETVTDLVFSDKWDANAISKKLRVKMSFGDKIFNNAYMVRGNDGQDKVDTVVNYTIQPLVNDPPLINTKSMEETWACLCPRYGMGSFMSGQIVADYRWAIKGSWKDKNSWAPVGPGSSRGVCWLHYREIHKTLKQSEFLPHLVEIRESAENYLPEEITNRMEMMDWQNTLCEFDKYMRVVTGQGRPKMNYKGEAN